MELYGQQSRSLPQKFIILASEIILVVASYLVLFDGLLAGVRAFGTRPEETRNVVLFAFNLVTLCRFLLTLFVFLRRKIPLEETFSVPLAFALYLLGFPLLARGAEVPFGASDIFGVGLFLVGGILNTFSEHQRHVFKRDPHNRGKLYDKGLFSLSIHVNYFGDLLWVTGYAFVTHNLYAFLIPVLLFCFFQLFNIPKLDAHLREHYGESFVDYERSTKRFVPFLF
jgi:protein-S-isoprenylcysteine O-methyltransferase Ste14